MSTRSNRWAGLRRWCRAHPEWWVLALALVGWAMMLPHMVQGLGFEAQASGMDGGDHHHHHHHRSAASPITGSAVAWMAMVVAMMLPLEVLHIRRVAFRSFLHVRRVGVGLFVLGYLMPWVVLAYPVAWVTIALGKFAAPIAVVLFLFSAGWTLTKTHERSLWSCHGGRPLPGRRWIWARHVFADGLRLGWTCLVLCWPMMLACALAGHPAAAMVGGLVFGYWLRFRLYPPYRWVAAGNLALAAWVGVPLLF
ncbi:MAG: DUF2182 domain-containing protein [Myxococcota bacterium]